MSSANYPVRYQRFRTDAALESVDGLVIAETSVTLTVNGQQWLSFSCTPTDLEALAVGFLFNEGVIQSKTEVEAVDVCGQGSNVDVWLSRAVERPTFWKRTSGCTGGLTTMPEPTDQEPAEENPPVPAVISASAAKNANSKAHITPQSLLDGMEQLLASQELYREAGGVHGSALSSGAEILLRVEDIGRHNTLDKLAGRMLLEGVQADPAIFLTTGRVSSEMLFKTARMGAVAVVSRTSPTSQSVTLAEQAGITLIGYARRHSFLVYAHPEHLTIEGNSSQ